jgi:hypothetical protein
VRHGAGKHFSLAFRPGQVGFKFFSAPKQNPHHPSAINTSRWDASSKSLQR